MSQFSNLHQGIRHTAQLQNEAAVHIQPNHLNQHPLIELSNLHKHYRVGGEVVRALDGVNLSIHSGEYVAIMGSSGSGKSTLMNILGCLDRPTEGQYSLNGIQTQNIGASALANIRNQQIGFVFQSFELMPRVPAWKNVALPLMYANTFQTSTKTQALKQLNRVGLSDRAGHKPNQLSGGQKQRVAIARALVNEPSILLADEPTGNLDSQTSEEILKLFAEIHQQGHTVVMVTHESDVAACAQRVIRMKDGQIASDLPVQQDQAWAYHPSHHHASLSNAAPSDISHVVSNSNQETS